MQFSSAGTSDPEGDPLTYSWSFGDGDTATGQTVSHTYSGSGTYLATLRVSDGFSISTATVRIFAGDCPPSAAIQSPTADTLSTIGHPVPLQATGSDPDGPLSDGAFKWDVILVHKGHRHEVGTFTGRSAQFQPVADHDADSHYEVTLSVTDADGFTLVLEPVTVDPATVRLRLRSNIGKLKLSYGGRTVKAPDKFRAAIGFRANLSAPAHVRTGGSTFTFRRWSQGGGRSQVFKIPAKRKTLVARYRRTG